MKKITLKEVPITLPDGVNVQVGMKVYEVKRHELGYSKVNGQYVSKWTGVASSYIVESTVIHLNGDANSRSFVVRSDRGCEHTYSVKNSCLPQIFGKRESAVFQQKSITAEDLVKIQKKIESTKKHIEDQKKLIAKYSKTATTLKKLRY